MNRQNHGQNENFSISYFEKHPARYKSTDFNHNYSRLGQREELRHTCFLYLFERQL